MKQGLIVKALSGFYYVDAGDGIYECRARGRFRHEKESPLVGDRVMMTADGEKGVVEEILPRKNAFVRPPVANIDVLVIIASAAIPVTVPLLLDRIITVAERNSCEPVICFNKADLKLDEAMLETYRGAGFTAHAVSAETGEGIEELRSCLAGKICAMTGNSGVGKSSILNRLDERFRLRVGEVSQKLGRGRHTTRHVELFRLDNGAIIADTPGFSSFDNESSGYIPPAELAACFREFGDHVGQCRFDDCSHTAEKGCAVIEAVKAGEISRSRHDSYVQLYKEFKAINTWELKDKV